MKHYNGRTRGYSLFLLFAALLAAQIAFAQETTANLPLPAPGVQTKSLTGQISVIHAISVPGSAASEQTHYLLTTEDGQRYGLNLPSALAAAGGVQSLGGQRVVVTGQLAGERQSGSLAPDTAVDTTASMAVLDIQALSPLGEQLTVQSPTLSGAQQWVSLLCKFADIPDEPRNLAYFQNMYSSAYPGLDHYWREASYDQMNLSGSNAFGWFTLPHPISHYTSSSGTPHSNSLLFDCLAAADPAVDFSAVAGLNLAFNAPIGTGTTHFISRVTSTLDGVRRERYFTGGFPQAYQNISVTTFLMGRAMEMLGSRPDFFQPEQANVWDVISMPFFNCAATQHATYGCVGQQVASHNRDRLGWVPANRIFVAPTGTQTITLEQLTQPGANNYLMAKIPIYLSDVYYYTLEVRRQVSYDTKLPGNAVIIHRELEFPLLIDADGNSNTADAGAMWTVGETFTDAENGVEISIDSATATGFVVTITRQERGRIIVEKRANPVTSQSFSFTSSYSDPFQLQHGGIHNSGIIPVGVHNVSETLPPNWTLESAACSDGSNPSAIQLDHWETVTCTFNNRQIPTDIIIIKQTIPDGATEIFTFSSSLGQFEMIDGGSRRFGPLTPGTYSFSETNLPAGWELTSATCDDGSNPASIDLAIGEVVTCTFTNTAQPGQITVVKQADLVEDTPQFTFSPSYGAQFQLEGGESHTSGPLAVGTYSVSEINIPPNWTLGGAFCTDGSPATAIQIGAGETVTCTFINHFTPPPNDPFEPNNTVAQATTIAYGQTKTGASIDPPGDLDYFAFTGQQGDAIVATVQAWVNGSALDSFLTLYNTNGTSVLATNDDAIGFDSRIQFTLPAAGTYYLQVRELSHPNEGGAAYTYNLNLTGTSALPTAAFTGTPRSGNAPLVVAFTDQSTGSPTSWAWTFGDGGTSTARHPSHTYTAPGAYTVSLTATNAQGSDSETKTGYITVSAPPASPSLYVTALTGGTVGSVAATPQDILFRNGTANTWAMHFNGVDVGVTKALAAFARLPNGDLLLVLKANQSLPGVGAVTPWDVVRFTGSYGTTTTGTFSWYIDGGDVGLTAAAEKIDALEVLTNGKVLISTTGNLAVPKPGGGTLKSQDEDLTAFTPTTTGQNTAGTWALYFDGTAVSGLAAEDVAGAHVHEATGDLYLSIVGAFNVGGVSGNGKDILLLHKSGSTYTVDPVHFWRGGQHGFNLNLGGIEVNN